MNANDETTKGQEEVLVELQMGVKIDPKEPRTVVVTIGKDSWGMVFDTETDAKLADAICTKMLELATFVFTEGKGVLKEKPKVWKPGEPEPEDGKEASNG